jgi:hypothetical protein
VAARWLAPAPRTSIEMTVTGLAGAAGPRRPTMSATTDSVPAGRPLIMRLLIRKWVYRHHPRAWAALCMIVGVWLVIEGAMMCSVGFWWGLALLAVGALEAGLGLALLRSVQR